MSGILCKYIVMLVYVAVVCICLGFGIVVFGDLLGRLGIGFVWGSRKEY